MGMKRAELIAGYLNLSKIDRKFLRKDEYGDVWVDFTIYRLKEENEWRETHILKQYPGPEALAQIKANKQIMPIVGYGVDWGDMTRERALALNAAKKARMAAQAAAGQKVEPRHIKRGV